MSRNFKMVFALSGALWLVISGQAVAQVTIYYSVFDAGQIRRTNGMTTTTLISGLDQPMALGFGPEGNLYVALQRGKQIRRYGKDFRPLGLAMTTGRSYTGLDLGPDGKLYAAATDTFQNGWIERYEPTTGIRLPGAYTNNSLAQFNQSHPSAYFEQIAFGPDGNLYAAGSSRTAGSIQVYQGPDGPEPGKLLRSISSIAKPFGLAFGPDNLLYISEVETRRILRYDGNELSVFATEQMSYPAGIMFGPDHDLYVADYLARKILRFEGPDSPNPGRFIDVFATTSGAPAYLLVVPEPGFTAIGIGLAALLQRRQR